MESLYELSTSVALEEPERQEAFRLTAAALVIIELQAFLSPIGCGTTETFNCLFLGPSPTGWPSAVEDGGPLGSAVPTTAPVKDLDAGLRGSGQCVHDLALDGDGLRRGRDPHGSIISASAAERGPIDRPPITSSAIGCVAGAIARPRARGSTKAIVGDMQGLRVSGTPPEAD